MEKIQHSSTQRVLLEVRTSRTGEETPESMVQFFSSLLNLRKKVFYFYSVGIAISLEIAVIDQRIHFYINIPAEYQAFIESQLVAQYPKVLISKAKDYLPNLLKNDKEVSVGQLKLLHNFVYPLRVAADFKDIDPMSSIVSILSKARPEDMASIQVLLVPISNSWQATGRRFVDTKKTDASGSAIPNPYTQVVTSKISYNGFKIAIRIAVASPTSENSKQYLSEIGHSFASFNNPIGNSLALRIPFLWQRNKLLIAMQERSSSFMPNGQILNVQELATLFHFPTMALAGIPNIAWHKVILSDPPELLPVAEGVGAGSKDEINFFASTQFKNKPTSFGIKMKDRRRHVYIIGKTGAGKSTLIANMAINDMRSNRGFCIIDPHGDLCETVLDYVPSYRINDIVYLDPGDHERAFSLNPLQVSNDVQKELVVSGIVAIFQKLFGLSWGPRLEYILRNTLLSIIEMPNPTLLMVPEVLTNQKFRNKVVANLQEPVLKNFWVSEFDKMSERQRNEAIAPILNKVGQFVQSRVIRNIIQSHTSTVDLTKIMDEGKILLLNLSQGRLGEDNAALLGAMIITKIQLAAMARVDIPEAERRDFYLYVDEFQNFATSSFIKILSEARKYRLNLLLANQYIAQVPEDVRAAIFGNAGTMLSFLIGAADANYMAKEFGERFTEEDLLALGNYQSIVKLCVDNITQSPFLAHTLPLPNNATQNREKVLSNSKQRYTKVIYKREVEKDSLRDKEEHSDIIKDSQSQQKSPEKKTEMKEKGIENVS